MAFREKLKLSPNTRITLDNMNEMIKDTDNNTDLSKVGACGSSVVSFRKKGTNKNERIHTAATYLASSL